MIEMVFSDYAKQRIVFYSSKYAYTMGVAPAYDRTAPAAHRTCSAPAPYLFAHAFRTTSELRANFERTSSEPRANLERTRSVPAVLYFNFFMTGTVTLPVTPAQLMRCAIHRNTCCALRDFTTISTSRAVCSLGSCDLHV